MLLMLCIPVHAGETQTEKTEQNQEFYGQPDQSQPGSGQTGSIELVLPAGQATLEITLYPVADYVDGGYLFSKDFAKSGIQITDLNNAEEAQKAAASLASYAKEQELAGVAGSPDENGSVKFDALSPALYLAAQSGGEEFLEIQAALIPVPYVGDDGAWHEDAVVYPKYAFPGGAVIVTKVDEDGSTVGEAQFVLQQKVYFSEGEAVPDGAEAGSDESGSFYWKEFQGNLMTSEHGQIVVMDMPVGEYRFVETQAPDGFIMTTEPAYFTITQAGQVAEVEGVYRQESGLVPEVQVVNTQTSVMFSKVDADGNLLSGAKLVLKDADGNVILDEEGNAKYAFTSGKEPYALKRLPAGDYFLCEVETPDGYLVSKDVPLTVNGTEAVTAEVTMVDEVEEETPGSLTVTKRLVDVNDNELSSENAVFYVALFADEALTERASGVKALEYHGNSSSSVTFSNLQMDTSYYVSETDAYGDPLESFVTEEVEICVPLYPESLEIRPTEQEPDHEFEFDNVFYKLPDGYYYVGKLNVTKEVLKGAEPFDTEEVFYAGVFEDAEYTQRVGDVIALEMNGGSETSVEVEVPIGDSEGAVQTYYVTETDADGNPLNGRTDLEYKVSVDHTEISFSMSDTMQAVVITNTFPEETPVPTETPVPSVTAGITPGGSTPGGSTSTGVKTGDDTPIGRFVIILVAAVLVISGVIVYRKKKK